MLMILKISVGWNEKNPSCIHLLAPSAVWLKPGSRTKKRVRIEKMKKWGEYFFNSCKLVFEATIKASVPIIIDKDCFLRRKNSDDRDIKIKPIVIRV